MKFIRRLHLYLGCFFAPLLLFYIATGWYQTANPDRRKGLTDSLDLISRLNRVHVDQYYPTASAAGYTTGPFQLLVAAMSVALILTLLLGVFLALRTLRHRWPVWTALALGVALPALLLWLGQQR